MYPLQQSGCIYVRGMEQNNNRSNKRAWNHNGALVSSTLTSRHTKYMYMLTEREAHPSTCASILPEPSPGNQLTFQVLS